MIFFYFGNYSKEVVPAALAILEHGLLVFVAILLQVLTMEANSAL